MNKIATINTRLEPALKNKTESILRSLGLSTAEAIRIFYTQICLHQGLPFEVKLPNNETSRAINELESGGGTQYHSMKEVWDDIKNA